MRRTEMLLVMAVIALTLSAPVVLAQQPQHQHDAGKQPATAPTTLGMPGAGMDAHMAKPISQAG